MLPFRELRVEQPVALYLQLLQWRRRRMVWRRLSPMVRFISFAARRRALAELGWIKVLSFLFARWLLHELLLRRRLANLGVYSRTVSVAITGSPTGA